MDAEGCWRDEAGARRRDLILREREPEWARAVGYEVAVKQAD